LLFDEPLKKYTYTKTGGPADVLAFPKEQHEVTVLVAYCQTENIPWMVLGNASNLIVRDGGIHGMVIMLEKMDVIRVVGEKIVVSAGAKLIDATYVALRNNITSWIWVINST